MSALKDLITQRDLELRIGSNNVARMCNDVGGNDADQEILRKVIGQASARARTLLYRAYPSNEQIKNLVTADEGVKMLVEDLAIGLMGDRRPGFLASDGKTPYSSFRGRAEKALRAFADADDRPAGEESAGASSVVAAEAHPSRAQRDPVFAASSDDPKGPGGF